MFAGHWEIFVIILIIVLLFVGPKKLPDFGKSLGKSIRDFKKSLKDEETLDVTDSAKAEKLDPSEAKKQTNNEKKKEKEKS